jgi:hypothetical protein
LNWGVRSTLFEPPLRYQQPSQDMNERRIVTSIKYYTTMDSPPQNHDQEDQAPEPVSGSPSDFLKNIVGKKVKVRIGSGVDYHGTSQSPLHLFRPLLESSHHLSCIAPLRSARGPGT